MQYIYYENKNSILFDKIKFNKKFRTRKNYEKRFTTTYMDVYSLHPTVRTNNMGYLVC